jgi:hypothetical protein
MHQQAGECGPCRLIAFNTGFESIMSAFSFQNTSEPAPARRYPRNKVVGGFPISTPVATAWASCLSGEELHPYHDSPSVLQAIHDKVRPHGASFIDVAEDASPTYMLVTQSARFKGYKDMDPKLIPQFKEGEREAIARKLLEEEGVLRSGTNNII